MNLGKRICEYRKRKNMSKEASAEKLQVNR